MQGLPGGALAASCARGSDASALKIAALQQELMVAALSCRDVVLYNRFVTSHQPELFASDGRLKSYFIRTQGGEAGYNTYKTELANTAALRSSRDAGDFCTQAEAEFATVSNLDTLSSYVDAHDFALADDLPVCAAPVVRSAEAARAPRDDAPGYFAPSPHRPMSAPGDGE